MRLSLLAKQLASPPIRAVLSVLIACPIITTIIVSRLSPETARQLLSERGPIEQQSPILWIVLSIFSLGLFGVRSISAWAAAYLALASAAREAGFHKLFTGESMLKISFYFHNEQPLQTKLVAGICVVLIGVSTAWLIVRIWKQFNSLAPAAMPAWVGMSLIVIATIAISKAFDRSTAILEDTFHFDMPLRIRLSILAVEESLEMLIPLAVAVAMLCFALAKPNPSPATDRPEP